MILKSAGAFFGLMREKKNGIQHFLEKSDWPTFFTYLFWIQKWKKPFYKCCSKIILKSVRAFFGLIKEKKNEI